MWGPPAVYALAIFASSSLSAAPSPPLHLTDKHVHLLAYAGLALVLVRALSGGRWAGVTPATALQAAMMTIAYGATDEWHQSFVPGRDADVRDRRSLTPLAPRWRSPSSARWPGGAAAAQRADGTIEQAAGRIGQTP